jgi:acetyl-CoA synthetase
MAESHKSQDSGAQVSEAQIAVHWREEEYYPPPPTFVEQANAADPAILERFSEDKFPDCFKEYADLLTWDGPWHTTLDTSNPPFWKWFVGGQLNASYNCVDRHAMASPDKTAIIFVPELESDAHVEISYSQLHRQVNEFAAVLRDSLGLKAGDRVTLHMPMVPELAVTMLACARLGVIHSQVFGGFSGTACGHRIADSGSRILITMDGYYRGGQLTDHKVKADEALAAASQEGQEVDKVLVWRRHAGQYASQTPMVGGRDLFVDELLGGYRGHVVEPVSMPAEAPLFLMYTSGTTGRPKGCVHSTGGYMAYVAGTSKYYQDIHPGDVYWCMADIGWITGHSYIVYGPLALGTTTVIYEGVPNYPDGGRPWRIAEKLGGEHLPHLAHRYPDAAQGRPGGAEEVRLSLQAHDHGGRADRARGLALVPLRGRQGRGGHRRHLVADRERRIPRQHAAGSAADEARQLRPGRARRLPCDLRRGRQRDPGGQR